MQTCTSRLEASGWSTIDPALFLADATRRERDVAADFERLLRRFSPGPRVLELCCGGASLVIALAERGYQVTGVDLGADMLAHARRRVHSRPQHVQDAITLVHADVCGLDLGRTFDFVILEDDSFVYFLTPEDQLACLAAMRRHMHADACGLLRFTTPEREMLADEDYELDATGRIKTLRPTWTLERDERRIQIAGGIERRRLTYRDELEELLQAAGLEAVHRWGDLDGTPLIDPAFQEYCYLIRPAPTGDHPDATTPLST